MTINVPDELDLSHLRGHGLQPGEEELQEGDAPSDQAPKQPGTGSSFLWYNFIVMWSSCDIFTVQLSWMKVFWCSWPRWVLTLKVAKELSSTQTIKVTRNVCWFLSLVQSSLVSLSRVLFTIFCMINKTSQLPLACFRGYTQQLSFAGLFLSICIIYHLAIVESMSIYMLTLVSNILWLFLCVGVEAAMQWVLEHMTDPGI